MFTQPWMVVASGKEPVCPPDLKGTEPPPLATTQILNGWAARVQVCVDLRLHVAAEGLWNKLKATIEQQKPGWVRRELRACSSVFIDQPVGAIKLSLNNGGAHRPSPVVCVPSHYAGLVLHDEHGRTITRQPQ